MIKYLRTSILMLGLTGSIYAPQKQTYFKNIEQNFNKKIPVPTSPIRGRSGSQHEKHALNQKARQLDVPGHLNKKQRRAFVRRFGV